LEQPFRISGKNNSSEQYFHFFPGTKSPSVHLTCMKAQSNQLDGKFAQGDRSLQVERWLPVEFTVKLTPSWTHGNRIRNKIYAKNVTILAVDSFVFYFNRNQGGGFQCHRSRKRFFLHN
jgi:hypothetical protein